MRLTSKPRLFWSSVSKKVLASDLHTHTHTYAYTHAHTHSLIQLLPLNMGMNSPQFSDSHKRNRILLHTHFTLQPRANISQSIDLLPVNYDPGDRLLCVQEQSVPSEPAGAASHGLEASPRHVSSHPVLSHERDDAGRWTRLCQEGVFEDFAGRGPLTWVPHQHPVQKSFEQWRDLAERREGDLRQLLLRNESFLVVCETIRIHAGFCGSTLCRFFSFGGKLSRIIFMALSGGSLKYGGSPSTISMTMIPSDQMST